MNRKVAILQCILVLSFLAAALPACGEEKASGDAAVSAGESRSSGETAPEIRPIKKRVGRAVTSTMDKIDNPWFIVSQIVIPICAFVFSLMYVRRYRAKKQASAAVAENKERGSPVERG